ncbi:MAG: HAD family hydrolase [Oscillospiraceae bacterium]|nr:HAD family hydrolase [Oscillospiraceae bacterium]
MKDIEWLFFDLGGTLIDETCSWDDRIRRTCKKHDIPEEEFRTVMADASRKNLHEYRGALDRFGISFGEKWDGSFSAPYEKAEKVLSALGAKYKLGVVANQPLNIRKRMENEWRLAEYFDLMIISAEVGFSKPDLRLFREALYKAQTTAEKCVMIGDKLTNDIAPAKKLGFKSVWIRQEWGGLQTATSQELEPDIVIDSLSELPALFL